MYWECFICLDGQVWNVSEWGICQGFQNHLRGGEHQVLVRVETGGRAAAGPDDFDAILRHILQRAAQDEARGAARGNRRQRRSGKSKRR